MDRVNGAGTIDIGSGRRGFRDEDLALGQEGTEVPALWLNMVQEEITGIIEKSDIALDPADWTQLARALQRGRLNYAVGGGTANAITATLAPAPAALVAGMVVRLLLSATNTIYAPTLNVNGLGDRSCIYADGFGLAAGELVAGKIAVFVYDGSSFVLINPWLGVLLKTPAQAKETRAFIPNVALSDILPATETVAVSITVTGASYLDCVSYVAFKNGSGAQTSMTGRLRLVEGATIIEDSDYLGCINSNGFQTPISLRRRFKNLDRTKTYNVQLIVFKADPVGPVQILDPMIYALHD